MESKLKRYEFSDGQGDTVIIVAVCKQDAWRRLSESFATPVKYCKNAATLKEVA